RLPEPGSGRSVRPGPPGSVARLHPVGGGPGRRGLGPHDLAVDTTPPSPAPRTTFTLAAAWVNGSTHACAQPGAEPVVLARANEGARTLRSRRGRCRIGSCCG